jgi:crotonobetaine/carnitine-CoA ligase
MAFAAELPGPALLARRAEELGDRVAVEVVGSDRRVSYEELHRSVLRWADALSQVGVGPGERVAVMLPTSVDAYVVWFALGWLRALEVPINTDYRGSILAYLIRQSKARTAVVAARYLDRLVEVASDLPDLETVVVLDAGPLPDMPFQVLTGDEFLTGAVADESLPAPGWDDIAAVIFTSGTTGPSKGVLVPWGELATMGSCFPDGAFTADSRLYSFWPTFHMSGKWPFYAVIDRSATLCLRERWKTDAFWEDVRGHRANLAVIFGPLPLFLAAQGPRSDDADNPLEHVVMAPVIPGYREFEARFGVKVHTASGMTEIGLPLRGYHPLPNHRTGGRLAPGYQIRVVDDEGRDVGPNVAGEALVRADDRTRLSLGYLDMPAATESAWQDGWFRTGDAFMYDDDGNWYFVDRLKDCLRRRGENISSFEVENAVNGHPDVLESAAVAVASEWGEQEVKILVVRHPGRTLGERELVEFLVPRMPRFMVPRYVEFVDELPKTPTGKVRKVELRDRGITSATWDRETAGVVVPR